MNIHRIRTLIIDNESTQYIRIWQSVLLMVFEDIENTPSQNYQKSEKQRTINWIVRKNRDFYAVCEYAGFCPERTHRALMNKLRKHNLVKDE